MCLIINKPRHIEIPERNMFIGFQRNPHGAGYMWANNGQLCIRKGFDRYQHFLKSFRKDVPRNLPGVVHFRMRSAGAIDSKNCHPFWVHKWLGMAHNGSIYDLSREAGASYNDTRGYIKEVLSGLPRDFIYNDGIRHLITRDIGSWNKMVFLDNHGKVFILNEKDGKWDGGCWYSNECYKEWGAKRESASSFPLSFRELRDRTVATWQPLKGWVGVLRLVKRYKDQYCDVYAYNAYQADRSVCPENCDNCMRPIGIDILGHYNICKSCYITIMTFHNYMEDLSYA